MSEHHVNHHEENHRIHRSVDPRCRAWSQRWYCLRSQHYCRRFGSGHLYLRYHACWNCRACSRRLAMAAGEYVSVKSQEDTERADLAMEAEALKKYPEEEMQS